MGKLSQFDAALGRFKESLELAVNPTARDSSILRFELLFETAWKACQEAARNAGIEVNSPRQAFGTAFRLGWISDEMAWREILDDRNSIAHTYNERLADNLYARLKTRLPHFEELNRSLHQPASESSDV